MGQDSIFSNFFPSDSSSSNDQLKLAGGRQWRAGTTVTCKRETSGHAPCSVPRDGFGFHLHTSIESRVIAS
jgi:hypothetical protein